MHSKTTLLALVFSASILPGGAQADEPQELLKICQQHLSMAQSLSGTEKRDALLAAQDALNQLLRAHPSTDLALQVALGTADTDCTPKALATMLKEPSAPNPPLISASAPRKKAPQVSPREQEANALLSEAGLAILTHNEAPRAKDRYNGMYAPFFKLKFAARTFERIKSDYPKTRAAQQLAGSPLAAQLADHLEQEAKRLADSCGEATAAMCLFADAERLLPNVAGDDIGARYTYSDRDLIRMELANFLAQAGARPRAEAIAAKIKDMPLRSKQIIAFAKLDLEDKHYDAAREALRTHADALTASALLGAYQAQEGETRKADTLFAESERAFLELVNTQDHETTPVLIEALCKAGRFRDALRLAKEISQSSHQENALQTIAIAQVDAGLFNNAETTIYQIKDTLYREIQLRELVTLLSSKGEFRRAERIAKGLDDDGTRLAAFTAIAWQSNEAKDDARRDKYHKKAKSLLDDIPSGHEEHAGAVLWMARMEARLKNFDAAEQYAEELRDTPLHPAALQEIAIHLSKSGQTGRAIAQTQDIKDTKMRDGILLNIAAELIEVGRFAQAWDLRKEIRDSSLQILLRLLLGSALSEPA